MSIAAEHVAGRQRLRERLRAVTLETTLAVSGLVAIAVRVLDDNFIQPQPGLRRSTTALAAWYRPPARFRSRRAILLKRMAKKVAQQLTPLFDRSVKEDRHE